jgi:hypothetical protein
VFKKLVKKVKSTAKKAVKKVKSTAKKVTTAVKKVVKPKPTTKAVVKTAVRTAIPSLRKTLPQPTAKPGTTKAVTKAAATSALSKGLDLISRPSSAFLGAAKHSAAMEKAKPGSSWSPAGLKGGAQAFMRGLTGKQYTGGQDYLATKGVAPGITRSVVGTALDIGLTPGAGQLAGGLAKGGAAAARGAATKVLPRTLPKGVKYIPPAKVAGAGARTGATAARTIQPTARAALRPVATESAQAARVALQPTALATTGTRAVAPAIQSAATSGMRAGATQAARAAQAGARSLGSRVAGAGAAAGAGLASGARAVGSGLKTAGQWAGRNWKPIAGLGAAGGLAYGLWPRGDAMDEEMEGQQMAQEEPQMTPEGWGSGGYGGYGGGGGYGGMSGMGGIGMGGMTDAMPDWGQLQNELFSAIDSAAGQNSAMTISWLNQMTDTLNQLEQDIIEQYRQQGQEIDPATQAALKQIRDQVNLRRQGLMEEMNRRGVLQSGIWLEEENRLLSGQLNAEEQLLAGRLSDLQNRLTDTMQDFAQQRMNIMGTAWQNEMDTARWAGQQKVGAIQDISQRQDDWNRWWAEMGLKTARLNRSGGGSSGGSKSSSATKQFIQQIPSYGSLQDALQDFNNYKGDMMAQGADVAAVLQNIYAYFGS